MKIKAENLCLAYGQQKVLHDLSFELSGEKIYGLLGRNGAGKTSLLSIIASFREPSSGVLTINGEVPFENARIMQQVAFLYNKDYSNNSQNAGEILEDVERYRPNFDKEYAMFLLELFQIDMEKPVKQFSKGKQSVLNAVIGLAGRTPITIFDEVYLGMDAPSREKFYQALLEEQEKHPRLMILSTHLVSEMDHLFDEVLILKQGRLLFQEDYESLVSKGVTLTGNAKLIDEFVKHKERIHEQQLGDTKRVTIYGRLNEKEKASLISQGIEIASVSLQDLFIYLTEEE